VRGLLQALVSANARYRAAVHFSRLDDHLLRDIGLSRSELRSAVAGRKHSR
jgi:uncharacterized protein YjiS (DUF1127 family)